MSPSSHCHMPLSACICLQLLLHAYLIWKELPMPLVKASHTPCPLDCP